MYDGTVMVYHGNFIFIYHAIYFREYYGITMMSKKPLHNFFFQSLN